jgi:hypothetical protein
MLETNAILSPFGLQVGSKEKVCIGPRELMLPVTVFQRYIISPAEREELAEYAAAAYTTCVPSGLHAGGLAKSIVPGTAGTIEIILPSDRKAVSDWNVGLEPSTPENQTS